MFILANKIKEFRAMKLLPVIILLWVFSGCSAPQKQGANSNAGPIETVNVETKDMSIEEICTTYLVPPYLSAARTERHLYDTCIFKRDTVDFCGEKYYRSAYKLFPSNFKTCYANFFAIAFKNGSDSTWVLMSSPWERLAIVQSRENVTFFNPEDWANPDSIEQVMALFSKSADLPSARLQSDGVDASIAGTHWKCEFKKNYHEGCLELKSITCPNCSFYIVYPYKIKHNESSTRIREGADMLPPWLFYDFSVWFNYFSNDKAIRISHPDFSDFPGGTRSSLKAVRWDDERANTMTLVHPKVDFLE